MSAKETKACPFCGEEILDVAVKCKHCGSDLSSTAESAQPDTAAEAGAAKSGTDLLGLALLMLPALGAFLLWVWVSNSSLINASSNLTTTLVLVIGGTAVMMAVDSSRLGFGKTKGKKENGPVSWFFGGLMLWIVAYPWYMFARVKKGGMTLGIPCILLALVFGGYYVLLHGHIQDQLDALRRTFGR